MENKFFFAIDRGGTFTDVLAICPDRRIRTMKLLSEDPARYADAPREGIRRILAEELGEAAAVDAATGLVETRHIGRVQMGTTVATNALLERAGEPVGLVVNRGFRDLLEIGNQARPKIFDLNIRRPTNLYRQVVEIGGRLVPAKEGECELPKDPSWRTLPGTAGTGAYLEIEPLDPLAIRSALAALQRDHNIHSVAVVLAHSYACPAHELAVGEIAASLGMRHITLSHQAMPMCRIVPRGYTACAEAYLTPHVHRYLESFRRGFRDQLQGVEVLFMQSDGGLAEMAQFRGARAILSGPAGGVVGYAKTGAVETELPLIGFDMGGTSTDVSRFAGHYEHVIESTTAGITIQAPQLDINTVAAGGGSRLFFRSGLFVVGPESAGAHPGPACYRKGGPLTVTDANLVLGRLQPDYFPKIFGSSEAEPLDAERPLALFEQLRAEINAYQWAAGKAKRADELSVEEVAAGFLRVANEAMCRPIRALTQSRGFDTSRHALACFGGAGGQHACSIARELGMRLVLVHKYAGILSAYGMALADVVQEDQRPCGLEYSRANGAQLERMLAERRAVCVQRLAEQGFAAGQIEAELFLHMRYEGTDGALMCAAQPYAETVAAEDRVTQLGDFQATFVERYRSEYGFVLQQRRIVVDDVRCRASGRTAVPQEAEIARAEAEAVVDSRRRVFFDGLGYVETPVYLRIQQAAGHRIAGPAIIIDALSTIVVEPDCVAEITVRGDLRIEIGVGEQRAVGVDLDAVQLSIFSHRFMSIAEQMGRILQRTSISTNIKERLDFSCALFGPDGGLVSNAPHIPVHLGSMQEAVQYQLKLRGATLKRGDVLLSNHPQAGGSHLPDLTVITPVFYDGSAAPVFFVASRGHHADIGGITPGSMPPHSTSLAQEGAAFMSFLLVEQDAFREAAVTEHLCTPTGAPGAVGTRNLADNLSDLRAQVAANHKGIQLVGELIDAYGLPVVQAYMLYIQQNAELAVRDMLREIAAKTGGGGGGATPTILRAEQHMDDGAPIRLSITIDAATGSAVADFAGTSAEVWGNCNAPRAITLSALIYCLRCMVGHDVPLNQGCLRPLEVRIPAGSILDPSEGAAVVGGNVQTSQRIVDTVLQAFSWCAASQGCMNNVTLGTERWGYYETVAGGSGAGPGWAGTSGVHTHMTNTRITDPEIVETRYPMVVRRFRMRGDDSGGAGRWRGGEGVERELWFRAPVQLSVLTERRVLRPYGMAGGGPGKCGENYVVRGGGGGEAAGRVVRLAGKTAVRMEAGDAFRMLTPGGGGYGVEGDEAEAVPSPAERKEQLPVERGSLYNYRQAQDGV